MWRSRPLWQMECITWNYFIILHFFSCLFAIFCSFLHNNHHQQSSDFMRSIFMWSTVDFCVPFFLSFFSFFLLIGCLMENGLVFSFLLRFLCVWLLQIWDAHNVFSPELVCNEFVFMNIDCFLLLLFIMSRRYTPTNANTMQMHSDTEKLIIQQTPSDWLQSFINWTNNDIVYYIINFFFFN